MKGRTYTIHPGGNQITVSPVLHEGPTLAQMQEAVGGYIESVPQFTTFWTQEDRRYVSCIAYCNENGKLEGMTFNPRATLAWDTSMRRMKRDDGEPVYPSGLLDERGQPTDVLVGPIFVIVGDEEFMRAHLTDVDEEDEPDPDWWIYDGEFVPAFKQQLKT